jgi:PAS domain-containing protein
MEKETLYRLLKVVLPIAALLAIRIALGGVRASTSHIGPRILATLETLTADETGRYIAANDAVCNLTGYSQGELLYMSIWDLSPELDVKTIRRAGGFDGEYQLWRATGEPIEIRCIAAADVIPGLHVATMASC